MTEEKTTSEWFEGILDPSKYRLFDFGTDALPIDETHYVFHEDGTMDVWETFLSDEEI